MKGICIKISFLIQKLKINDKDKISPLSKSFDDHIPIKE